MTANSLIKERGVYEVMGTLFFVEYTRTAPISIHTVRVVDGDYKPCGPELAILADNIYTLQSNGPLRMLAESLLAHLIGEINERPLNTEPASPTSDRIQAIARAKTRGG
jgi:hypothetical protein